MASILMGETVNLRAIMSSTSTSTNLGIYDADDNARPLLSFERLIIDDMMLTTDESTKVQLVTGGSTALASTLILSFDNESNFYHTDAEGVNVPTGITPVILPLGSTVNAELVGTGRIINGTTQGVRPNWRESLVP
jgi:hypothetical protein